MELEEEIAQELSVADWGAVHSDYIVSHYTKQAERILPIIARREQEIERETVEKICAWLRGRDGDGYERSAQKIIFREKESFDCSAWDIAQALADAVKAGKWKG